MIKVFLKNVKKFKSRLNVNEHDKFNKVIQVKCYVHS